MERVLDYMRRVGIRPIDLIRQFDKTATMEMTTDAFIRRLEVRSILSGNHWTLTHPKYSYISIIPNRFQDPR